MSKMNIRPIPAGRFAAVVSIQGRAVASTLPSRNRNSAARAGSLLLGQIRRADIATRVDA